MRVLVAEDDATSRLVLETTLRKRGYEVVSAEDGEMAWGYLSGEDHPRLALLDWMMPGLSGLEVCKKIRQRSDADERYVYIVFLTGKGDIKEVLAGLEAGADDYIKKPFNVDELELRLRAGKRIIELQDQLVEAKQLLRHQAEYDALTGILNRGALLKRVEVELARASRGEGCLGVAMMDLDHFKNVNDTHGHQAGDEVLREAVRRILGVVRPYDIFGRYGGEEFLLVIPTNAATTVPFERVRSAIAERQFAIDQIEIPVTLSIGVAWSDPNSKLEELLGRADAALYQAKENGRNRVEEAPPS